jgi:glycosyltransferase involved in cell wall biosynthesis
MRRGDQSERAIRVLALSRYGRQGASSRMRTFQYREPLAAQGIEFDIHPLLGDDYLRALYHGGNRLAAALRSFGHRIGDLRRARDYDAVWVEKEFFPWLPAFIELGLLPSDAPLIADYDDAVFHRYDQHRSALERAVLGRKLDRVMARADLVVAGNAYLAQHAERAGARRIAIVPTVVDLDRYPLRPRSPSPTLTVGWIGTPSTMEYFEPLKPVLRGLSQEIPMRVVAIGARPDQMVGEPFAAVPWSEAGEVEALRALDIGVMPLPDTPWERGKCGYKLIQYMALGLPVVASPVGANAAIVREGENGFLATGDDEWRAALTTLAGDPALRERLGQAGRRRVEAEYALAVQAPRLATLIRETVEGRGR